jgi:signal transduction histidine kinase
MWQNYLYNVIVEETGTAASTQDVSKAPMVSARIRFSGRLMRVARLAWYVCAVVAWGILILAVPAQLNAAREALQGNLAAAEPSSLLYAFNIANFLGFTAAALISLILATILFLKRPEDGMALFLSFFLLVYGVALGPLDALGSFWPGIGALSYDLFLPVIFGPFLVAFLSVFPNGRFVPSWTRWLVTASLLYAPVSPIILNTNADSGRTTLSVIGVLLWFGLIFAGLYAQIYRHRHISNRAERQQTKWVIYGLTLGVSFAFLLTLLTFSNDRTSPETPLPRWVPLVILGWRLAFAALPISFTFAVMRYRLYDVDKVINRTLVYGALTACVVIIYVLIVGTLGTFFQAQGNLLIALLATGIVAVLFQPLRERLQRGVNRLIYGERDDPFEALSRLGRRLESALPPDELLPALVETIAQTLKLSYVAIHLSVEEGDSNAAAYGNPSPDVVQFPLIYQGKHIGQLVVALRDSGSSFSPPETRLLRNIAQQTGAVAQAMQLTVDLQHSRRQLVTTREEERRRLRRDLHDGLGATLAALNLEASALRRLIRPDPEKAEALVDEFRHDIRNSIDNIRHLVHELRPPTLDQLGLVEAVHTQARQCSQADANGDPTLEVKVEAPEAFPPLPAAVEVAAYRIVQEALTNVVRHAQAQHCTVRLELADELRLEVVDDGLGLANGRPQKNGLGLLSMRERAEELGGSCVIEAAAGGGTRIAATLPLLSE